MEFNVFRNGRFDSCPLDRKNELLDLTIIYTLNAVVMKV